jgi:hypothetical protein
MFRNDITFAKKNSLYMALGFHEWVEGIEDQRLRAFKKLIEYITKDKNIVTKTLIW